MAYMQDPAFTASLLKATQELATSGYSIAQNIPRPEPTAVPVVKQPSTVGVYAFDDLLVACSQEVIINGIDTAAVPGTIRDWLCGRIVQALPRELINKLLTAFIENRDFTERLAYKEKITTDVSEMTILMYRNVQMRAWHDAKNKMNGEIAESEPTLAETDETGTKHQIFEDQGENLRPSGIRFFTEELLLDHAQIVPSTQPKYSAFQNRQYRSKRMKPNADDVGLGYTDNSEDESLPTMTLENQPDSEEEVDDEVERICEICNFVSKNRVSLRKHQKRLHPEYFKTKPRPYRKNREWKEADIYNDKCICDLCGAAYGRERDLYRHLRKNHPGYLESKGGVKAGANFGFGLKGRGNLFHMKCAVCDARFQKLEELDHHQETEHPQFWAVKLLEREARLKQCTCTICGKTYSKKVNLQRHMFTHTGGHPHSCQICQKGFVSEYKLKRHMTIHTGVFPFNCEVCNQGFRDEYKYREIHCKTKHPEAYRAWKQQKIEENLMPDQRPEASGTDVLGGIGKPINTTW